MSFDIKRRKVLKVSAATVLTSTAGILYYTDNHNEKEKSFENQPKNIALPALAKEVIEQELAVRDNIFKVKNFEQTFNEDVFLTKSQKVTFKSTLKKIISVKNTIGYANFNLISFDDMKKFAKRFPNIGSFTKAELALIDEIFFFDANKYGFHGSKVIKELTSKINKKDTVKISGSGHYLFQGEALNKFKQLKQDVGPNLILTSGVRSIVKQLQLFFAKLESSNGNLSLTSRSLAPPGHSYHGIGDFDVGKKGFGKLNFTADFASTTEYNKLIELKYVDLRYTKDNQVGVRYEPWHIKVV